MPIPEPKKGQDKSEYMSECMAFMKNETKYPQQDQKVAICLSKWRKVNEKKDDIVDGIDSLLIDTTGTGDVANNDARPGIHMGMVYRKKKKKVKGEAPYTVHETDIENFINRYCRLYELNRSEIEEMVRAAVEFLGDKAYQGKITMGGIVKAIQAYGLKNKPEYRKIAMDVAKEMGYSIATR
jgi:hypothetical protein